jgi:hypothetical protein
MAVLPPYAAIIGTMVNELSPVHYIVLFALLGPVIVAMFQSVTSGVLYVLYLPWFLFLGVFFLVYIPSYSYARFYDTTWGNRAGGADEAITKQREDIMRHNVIKFNIGLIIMNWCLTLLFSVWLNSSTVALVFLLILFSPTIIQIAGAVAYLLFVAPINAILNKRGKEVISD